jgi:outer membrane biogenesis lipoprotein LolB
MRSCVVALPALAVLLLAGCSDEPKTVDAQNIGFCVAPSADFTASEHVEVEFRHDGKVVATTNTDVGSAIGVQVPTGEIDVYVDGKPYGQATNYGPSTLDEDGQLRGSIYISGPGCPTESPIG